ncbi:MAG: uncharacterized protein JWO69_1673 [Thermoleophilia bacterium]|jgi:hypothetical protein|nr:uncharacterized protein [Thermoleophilia bacterium]
MRKLQANDYELGFLEGWRDNSQVVLIGPERPVFTPNVQVHREPVPPESLAEFLREQRAELSKLDGFSLVEHGERRLGGEAGVFHRYEWVLPNHPGERIRQLQVVAVRNQTLFTVTCSALVRDWDGFDPAFEMTLAGFAWR